MKQKIQIIIYLLLTCLVLPIPAIAEKKKGNNKEKNDSVSLSTSTLTNQQTLLQNIKFWSNPDYTRVALELDRDATWSTHELGKGSPEKPGRVYIDLKNARLGREVKDFTIEDGLLKGVRVAQYRQDVVRIVLDTLNIKDYKVFSLSEPARLIIDVRGERRAEISKLEESISTLKKPLSVSKPEPAVVDKKVKPARSQPVSKVRRIVVDPGHGGHDPGAIGLTGLQEKDVVLSIGLKLKELLEDELDLDVVMTRSTDVFIPLEERTAIANKVNADLFVSIHGNAAPNRNAAGIETYYLNLAKTEKAAQLAAKENGTSLEKVSVLQAILFDLMANYKLNDSAHLAEEVQRSLHKKARHNFPDVKNLGVKQGPFYVLVGATMPSILVEVAFLSNALEESRLRETSYHEMTAEGIMEGIRSYIASLK